ncbi:MAG: ribosomal-protein-alanine N-acetyltransferase [Lachnospiraceae bacterium]|nr:ribosomal-protein-alanine N-acetyltransferase [Lachnospiraceae bacterium]MBQ9935553.1 ribosomal protein S18-alanine N-acetyltransferase [Lachnospiraceae bacterium]
MATIDEDLMLRQISRIEKDNFSDPWSLDSLWGSMVRDYNLIYFALGNEEKYTIYSFRGGEEILISGLVDVTIKHEGMKKKPSEILLMGYIIATDIADESELLRVAVADKYKRLGIGRELMKAYKEDLKPHCDKFFLEVRQSNEAAKAMYEKVGYKSISIRKDYYSDPKEDAVIYSMETGPYYKLEEMKG